MRAEPLSCGESEGKRQVREKKAVLASRLLGSLRYLGLPSDNFKDVLTYSKFAAFESGRSVGVEFDSSTVTLMRAKVQYSDKFGCPVLEGFNVVQGSFDKVDFGERRFNLLDLDFAASAKNERVRLGLLRAPDLLEDRGVVFVTLCQLIPFKGYLVGQTRVVYEMVKKFHSRGFMCEEILRKEYGIAARGVGKMLQLGYLFTKGGVYEGENRVVEQGSGGEGCWTPQGGAEHRAGDGGSRGNTAAGGRS